MKITKDTIETCKQKSITLDELVYLYDNLTAQGWNVSITASSMHKLRDMGYLDRYFVPTKEVESLLARAFSVETKIKSSYTEEFNEFWKIYPKATEEGRALRSNKSEAFKEYSLVLASGYSPQHLLSKLKQDLANKASSKEGLKYMRGIVNWLRLETFNDIEEPILEHSNAKII